MDLELARTHMVEQQIRPWEVLDTAVLETMGSVPRELFVPPAYRELAFADTPLPLGHGEVMMSPKLEARTLQALDLGSSDRVLEIGTGSGFLAACLARLGGTVLSIDIYPEFTAAARTRLEELDIGNVDLETADASRLDAGYRGFDAIAVTASLPTHEPSFERALNPGGRLFVIVGTAPIMEALLITRIGENEWARESLFETLIPPLVNARREARFSL